MEGLREQRASVGRKAYVIAGEGSNAGGPLRLPWPARRKRIETMKRREFLMAGAAVPGLLLSASRRGADGFGASRARPDERFERLARLVSERMAEYGVPGVAFGVLKDGEPLMRGFGVTNVEEPLPITENTVFQIASLSKTVTATAMMGLVERGQVDLRAPVRQYLPDFRVRDERAGREVTVLHLLTHTPGWEGQLTAEDRGTETLAHFARSMSGLEQLAPAGAVWSYNNPGYALAGRVIEVVTGMDIHEAFRNLVFGPLGLTRASTRLGDIATYRLAVGHRTAQGGATEVVRPFAMGSSIPAGGVAMSISDLLSYAEFHLGRRDGAGGDVLSIAGREAMREPQVRKNATEDEMGIGWHLRRLDGVLTASHGGSAGAGHRLHLQLVPERNLAFAILTNHVDGWRLVQDVERATLGIYEGLSVAPNQAIAYRGVNESMTHASPLQVQPPLGPYVGAYRRSPTDLVRVRDENGTLVLAGEGTVDTSIVFYGPDVAYSSAGGSIGAPIEFIRARDGELRWMRMNGRIARKDPG